MSADAHKKILAVSTKSEAQPVLGQLRAAGHQVSLVEDMDEGRALLASEKFDQALLPAGKLVSLLERRARWEGVDQDTWRRSTSGIAHDLRTLLGALDRGVAELNRSHGSSAGEDVLEPARRSISVISSFLRELTGELEGGASEDLELCALNLEDAVEAAAMTVYPSALERRQRLVIDVHDDVTSIQGDAAKLKRALANLLDHASKQGPELGTVTVRARREQDNCVIVVSYSDDGNTLSELRRLFTPAPHEPAPSDSSLSRVQRLVAQHGGRCWVESDEGADTCVFVSLPLGAPLQRGSVAVNA